MWRSAGATPAGLLEAVEGALKKTNGIGARRVDEAGGLLTIDGLVQVTVKKGILHVQLVDRPLTRSSDAEDDPNRCRLDDGAERLVIVDAVSLGEAADDPASLMTSQRAVGVELMPEDLFAGDDIGARRPGDEAPCVVVDESLVLLSHNRAPLRVGKGPSVVTGNGRGSRGGSDVSSWWEAITINRLQRAGLEARHRPARCRRRRRRRGRRHNWSRGLLYRNNRRLLHSRWRRWCSGCRRGRCISAGTPPSVNP
jgi:hypothetical protein